VQAKRRSPGITWQSRQIPKLTTNRALAQSRSDPGDDARSGTPQSVHPSALAGGAGCSAWISVGVFLLVEVVAERLGAGGVAQFGHRLGFDLPDALSGDPVELADFFERAWWAVGEAES
jgi:hypothetical protein